MELIHELINIPVDNMYVTLTEHKGEDFHLFEKYLASWQEKTRLQIRHECKGHRRNFV